MPIFRGEALLICTLLTASKYAEKTENTRKSKEKVCRSIGQRQETI
jgi:hypothetical protein